MTPTSPVLRIERLHKAFGSTEVLRGIDLAVDRGEVLCVIGPSGSGKSTLLRCINFLEEPTAGLVYVDGEPIGYRGRRRASACANRGRSTVSGSGSASCSRRTTSGLTGPPSAT